VHNTKMGLKNTGMRKKNLFNWLKTKSFMDGCWNQRAKLWVT